MFTTSFLIDDWLDEEGTFGADTVVIASASSKTALGLAYLLAARGELEVTGLTSATNAGFVESVGYYDRTFTYDQIDDLPERATVFVDMAGAGAVLAKVHRRLADSLRQSCLVGATHWQEVAAPADLPGPQPTFFFAPDRVDKRRADWGPGGLEEQIAGAWTAFLGSVDGWLTIVERTGRAEVEATWRDVLDGTAPPNVGYVASLSRP